MNGAGPGLPPPAAGPANVLRPVCAWEVMPDGGTRSLTVADLDRPPGTGAAYRWVHLDLADPGLVDWLNGRLEPVVAAALPQAETRPRCATHDHGVLLNLRGVNLNPGADAEDMISIRLWVEPWLIISVTKRRLVSLERVRSGFDAGKAPASAGGFLVALAAEMTERMEPVSAALADDIDDIEDRAFIGENGLGPEIASNRRKTVQLRRFVAAQRDALFKLAGVEIDLFTLMQRSRLRELSDRVTRLVEQMDEVKDRAQVVNDEIAAQRAESLARVSFVLSLAGVFFLPLGFLTGLLGVNLGGIPGTDSPWAFTVFCAVLLALGAVLALVMRRVRLG